MLNSNKPHNFPLYIVKMGKHYLWGSSRDGLAEAQKIFFLFACYFRLLSFIMLGKISADDILKYFLIFPRKLGFVISCKMSGDNLHKMTKPIFWERKKKKKKTYSLSSAEFAYGVVKVSIKWQQKVTESVTRAHKSHAFSWFNKFPCIIVYKYSLPVK